MGRPVYPYELSDPDFCWLVSHFQENHPEYCIFESGALPVVFIKEQEFVRDQLSVLPEGESVGVTDAKEE